MLVRIVRKMTRFSGQERGLTMVETIMGLAVLGLVGAEFMTALSSSFHFTEINDEKVIAENLIRSELEYLRGQTYCEPGSTPYVIPTDGDCGTYAVPPAGITTLEGYTLTVELNTYCCDALSVPYPIAELQQVTASVRRDGMLVSRVSDLKTKR